MKLPRLMKTSKIGEENKLAPLTYDWLMAETQVPLPADH